MAVITLDKDYNYPEDWQDITLDKFNTYLKIEMPTSLQMIATENPANKWRGLFDELPNSEKYHCVQYFLAVLSHFCMVEEEILQRCKIEQVIGLFWRLFKLLNTLPKYEYTETIQHNNQTFYFPAQFMQNSTVIDFLEACQLEMQYNKLKHGKYEHLAKLMCILCRRSKTEPYSDALLSREPLFKQMTMDNVWKCAFFLQKQNEKLVNALQTFTLRVKTGSLKLPQE